MSRFGKVFYAGHLRTVEARTGGCTSWVGLLKAVCGEKIQEKLSADENRKLRRRVTRRAQMDGVTAYLKRRTGEPSPEVYNTSQATMVILGTDIPVWGFSIKCRMLHEGTGTPHLVCCCVSLK